MVGEWRQGATVALKGFVCFGRGKLLATWKTYAWRSGWGANGRSIKPPRSTKQRDEENLRDRKIMFIQLFTIRGFHWQVLVDATLAGLQCDEFWWKKSSVTSFKMSCSRNAYNSRTRLEKPSPLDYINSKVCMLYNIKFQRYHMIQTYPSCSFRFVGLSLSWSAVCIQFFQTTGSGTKPNHWNSMKTCVDKQGKKEI